MSHLKHESSYSPVPLEFYRRDTLALVPEVLGKVLVRNIGRKELAGRIVEIEAYIGNDPASHAMRGITERNWVMYEDGGLCYVYFTYGMHYCFNIVTDRKGFPAAFLVRALEPLTGIEEMKRRRNSNVIRDLTNGPAKLCQAMGIDRMLNGARLDRKTLFVADDGFRVRESDIGKSTRIGIKVGTELEWRFFLIGNEFVSRHQPMKNTLK